ncbi:hypothetical protein PGT21_025326 [Puccinia graminis f. sp. tritici]|uniref:Uncharacterized protein n=1 Tax=Puccinia graminis f. sp. tritici TaxID=56615 RepID=A0A5B0LPC9_PUCGR|nr:hypothetical protein PGTUg99_025866 [Puccinia graminis f. sp. tritici]KAA1072001.1 hypothetical protein PGT21_025326 [Puccinia graminis f. sp. tritici]
MTNRCLESPHSESALLLQKATIGSLFIFFILYTHRHPSFTCDLTILQFQMICYIFLRHGCALLALSGCSLAQSSGNLLESLSGASLNQTRLPQAKADAHAGVSDTFNIALHDPTIALSTPGMEIGINCPAAVRWNEQYARNLTLQGPTDDEKEQAWIVSYMARHPDQTLWELFTKTLDQDIQNWIHGPNPVEKAADGVVHFTVEVIEQFIKMIWAAFKWVVKFPFKLKKEWQQFKNLGAELWDGTKIAAHLFAESPINGLKTITGGLFLHLLLHPEEFTAESILLVGAGFQVINWLVRGIEAIAGSLPPIVGKALMSFLWFIHSLDDPLLIVTPIFTNTAQALQAGKGSILLDGSSEENGGFTSDDGSKSVTLPAGTVLPASKQCPLLPPDLATPPLTYGNLCLSQDSTKVREIIFGTPKPSNELTCEERLQAYNHVQKFWCCYGDNGKNSIPIPDAILQDIPGQEQWEGKTFWKSVDIDCQKIFDENPQPSSGRLTIKL